MFLLPFPFRDKKFRAPVCVFFVPPPSVEREREKGAWGEKERDDGREWSMRSRERAREKTFFLFFFPLCAPCPLSLSRSLSTFSPHPSPSARSDHSTSEPVLFFRAIKLRQKHLLQPFKKGEKFSLSSLSLFLSLVLFDLKVDSFLDGFHYRRGVDTKTFASIV